MDTLEVWRSNRLTQASYELTLPEARCMWQVLSGIHYKKDGVKPDTFYKIDLDSYATTWEVSRNQAYIDVNKGLRLLESRTVTIRESDILPIEGKKSADCINWVDEVVLSNQGTPAIRWEKSIIPYLLDLKAGFTKLRLQSLVKLKRFTYIRLYEVFKQYEKIGKRILSVEELQDIIDIDRSCESFGHLKSRKIDPALKAINSYTEISVSYSKNDYTKAGRKVVKVKFSITREEKKAEEAKTLEIQALVVGLGNVKCNLPSYKGRKN